VLREGSDLGIAEIALRRARKALGVQVRREGFGTDGRFLLALPSNGSDAADEAKARKVPRNGKRFRSRAGGTISALAVPVLLTPVVARRPGRAEAHRRRPDTQNVALASSTEIGVSLNRQTSVDELVAEGDRMVGDEVAEEGIRSLKEINAGKRKVVRRISG